MWAMKHEDLIPAGLVEAHLRVGMLVKQTGLSAEQVLERAERSVTDERDLTTVLRDWARGQPPLLN